ncbi:MAG: response regulator [Gammaproteobacteria bacterium]
MVSVHGVEKAYIGVDALASAAAHWPEVVMLDIGLPGPSGYDVCRAMRRELWRGAMLIVALTGSGQSKVISSRVPAR